jgi:hypothetical protein
VGELDTNLEATVAGAAGEDAPAEPENGIGNAEPTDAQLEAQDGDDRLTVGEFQVPAGVDLDAEPAAGESDAHAESEHDVGREATAADLEGMAQLEELEKAREAYERKVRKILGPEAPLVACESCDGIGFDLTGGAQGAEYPEHPDFIQCEACVGLGNVSTGSKVSGSDIAKCPGCGGRGYLKRIERDHAHPGENGTHEAEAEYGLEPWMGDPSLTQPA